MSFPEHPKIKFFITHGGLHQNIGIELDINTITENQLRNAVYTVINSKRYYYSVILILYWFCLVFLLF